MFTWINLIHRTVISNFILQNRHYQGFTSMTPCTMLPPCMQGFTSMTPPCYHHACKDSPPWPHHATTMHARIHLHDPTVLPPCIQGFTSMDDPTMLPPCMQGFTSMDDPTMLPPCIQGFIHYIESTTIHAFTELRSNFLSGLAEVFTLQLSPTSIVTTQTIHAWIHL